MWKLEDRKDWRWQKKRTLEGELLEKYMTRILYRQNNGKFENEYLKRLQREIGKNKWEKTRQYGKIKQVPLKVGTLKRG